MLQTSLNAKGNINSVPPSAIYGGGDDLVTNFSGDIDESQNW